MYRLVEIDVHIPKEELESLRSNMNLEIEEIFLMDVDGESTMQPNSEEVEAKGFSRTLDICLRKIFMYMKETCYDSNGRLL